MQPYSLNVRSAIDACIQQQSIAFLPIQYASLFQDAPEPLPQGLRRIIGPSTSNFDAG